MGLVVLLGGARSGKSALAVSLAEATGRSVVFVATGTRLDEEMAERIARHRSARPPGWSTVEEPIELRAALVGSSVAATVVVDCLSVWVANLLEAGWDDGAVEGEASLAAAEAARRRCTIAVSNEVGLGVVPATPLGRRYRDVLGRVNAGWAAAAEQSLFVVAGRALRLASPDSLLDG